MATPPQPAKQMSSRLLTMKFMQRAANSSSSSSPNRPSGPPSKKQRLSNGSAQASNRNGEPAEQALSSRVSDRQAVQAALEAEERKRQAALDKAAAGAGETKWVLSFQEEPGNAALRRNNKGTELKVVKKGYAEIDWGNGRASGVPDTTEARKINLKKEDQSHPYSNKREDDEDPLRGLENSVGRRSFGRFNKSVERRQNPNYESSSNSSEASSDSENSGDFKLEDGDEGVDPTDRLIRSSATAQAKTERKAQKKAIKAATLAEAQNQHRGNINLERLATISARGGPGLRKGSDIECYRCGEKGHIARECQEANGARGKSQGTSQRRKMDF
ncbi:hypothetical protein EV356DRAFT_565964 [Viridothelium virens]|uniref:CCHC-type domain-containing protein n=1 Tax=Viridothelium virens TaxID=1048519 RepID=A0A6A6HD63_VIRVR|nr:hypothetical protein EV356DRAFT_565964 [Viridothelium virens]